MIEQLLKGDVVRFPTLIRAVTLPMTGIGSPEAETSGGSEARWSWGRSLTKLSITNEMEEPESIIISAVLLPNSPLTMAPCDLTAAITNLDTSHLQHEGLTKLRGAPSPCGTPLARFPNGTLWQHV